MLYIPKYKVNTHIIYIYIYIYIFWSAPPCIYITTTRNREIAGGCERKFVLNDARASKSVQPSSSKYAERKKEGKEEGAAVHGTKEGRCGLVAATVTRPDRTFRDFWAKETMIGTSFVLRKRGWANFEALKVWSGKTHLATRSRVCRVPRSSRDQTRTRSGAVASTATTQLTGTEVEHDMKKLDRNSFLWWKTKSCQICLVGLPWNLRWEKTMKVDSLIMKIQGNFGIWRPQRTFISWEIASYFEFENKIALWRGKRLPVFSCQEKLRGTLDRARRKINK